MADLKVFTQETIPDAAFPVEDSVVSESEVSTPSAKTYTATEIKEQSLPTPRVAVELISTQLNTQTRKIQGSFEFTPGGAIQVGKYEPGVSGDVKISPNGMVARDMSGNTTFALDGDTGNATFAGTVQAGTLISGAIISGIIIVGDNNVIMDGANKRILVNDGIYDRVLLGYQAGGF